MCAGIWKWRRSLLPSLAPFMYLWNRSKKILGLFPPTGISSSIAPDPTRVQAPGRRSSSRTRGFGMFGRWPEACRAGRKGGILWKTGRCENWKDFSTRMPGRSRLPRPKDKAKKLKSGNHFQKVRTKLSPSYCPNPLLMIQQEALIEEASADAHERPGAPLPLQSNGVKTSLNQGVIRLG